ncbi:hypothetical protein ACPA9J_06375 [Pseudomonas aeruginosa]
MNGNPLPTARGTASAAGTTAPGKAAGRRGGRGGGTAAGASRRASTPPLRRTWPNTSGPSMSWNGSRASQTSGASRPPDSNPSSR